MFNQIAILLFIVPAVILGQNSPFARCGNSPFPNRIDMPGCSGEVCRLRLNTPTPVTVDFNAQQRSQVVLASGEILIGGRWVTVVRNSPVCPLMVTGRCPLEQGNRYVFRHETNVRRVPVGTRTSMRFRVYNESNVTVLCFTANFLIVN